MENEKQKILPDLVGIRFVKTYTAFLMDAVKTKRCTAEDLTLKGFMENGVSIKTTKRYINDLIDLGLLHISDDGFLSLNEVEAS